MTGIVRTSRRRVLAALLATFPLSATQGADIGVAVASNFRFAIEELAEAFETTTGHHVVLSVRPIEQQAVLIVAGEPAESLMAFLRGAAARRIIRNHGYETP